MLQNTENDENYNENSTLVLGPDVKNRQKSQKSTSFIVKNLFKSIDPTTPKSTRITSKKSKKL